MGTWKSMAGRLVYVLKPACERCHRRSLPSSHAIRSRGVRDRADVSKPSLPSSVNTNTDTDATAVHVPRRPSCPLSANVEEHQPGARTVETDIRRRGFYDSYACSTSAFADGMTCCSARRIDRNASSVNSTSSVARARARPPSTSPGSMLVRRRRRSGPPEGTENSKCAWTLSVAISWSYASVTAVRSRRCRRPPAVRGHRPPTPAGQQSLPNGSRRSPRRCRGARPSRCPGPALRRSVSNAASVAA